MKTGPDGFAGCEKLVDTARHGNEPVFAFGSFRVRDRDELAVEVDVLPELAQEFAPPHPGIECSDDDGPEMFGAGARSFISSATRITGRRCPALPHHADAGDGIGGGSLRRLPRRADGE